MKPTNWKKNIIQTSISEKQKNSTVYDEVFNLVAGSIKLSNQFITDFIAVAEFNDRNN